MDLEPLAEPGNAGQARVDDVTDARDRQRGLGDVGGQHDASAGMIAEDLLLVVGRETAIQGEDLGKAVFAAVEKLGRIADLAFAGEEHEDVALVGQLADGVVDGKEVVTVVAFGEWAIADFDRKRAAADLDHGGVEHRGETVDVDRRRGDDDLEVGAAGEERLEITEKEVDRQRAFVRLVDDDRVVAAQVAIAVDFGEQQPVGHQLDRR